VYFLLDPMRAACFLIYLSNMESQQIVDYIRQQIAAGYTEATLRQHLMVHGWSASAVADAFAKYRKSVTPKKLLKAKKLRRGGKLAKKTNRNRIKLAVTGAAAVALVVAGTHLWIGRKDLRPVNTVAKPLTYAQKQSFDVNTIGGAVSQFSADNGGLPDSVAVSADGSLLLCGVDCNTTAAAIAPLQVYQASSVKVIPYQSGFTTTDKQTMYLMPGAKCADTHNLGGENANPRAIVILYAQENGLGVTPKCVTL
jgi:hypothetical protein